MLIINYKLIKLISKTIAYLFCKCKLITTGKTGRMKNLNSEMS